MLLFHPSWGPSLGRTGPSLETLPLRPALVGPALGKAARAPGQPPAPPLLARSSGCPGVVGGAGAAAAPLSRVPQCSALAGSGDPWFRGGGGGGSRRALRKPSGCGWKEATRPLGCAVSRAGFWGAR
ncbi:uncharacterized protein LOC116560881 [Sapajus apella]|uniref:Uncharacterized protein LOC116560881 n=1 Tax=Sapajus apella TaxID=9515 RepID=A0A6J3J137_SAPAP|nr:uncharacterized protein LOC116560881 [Sapajus apella]